MWNYCPGCDSSGKGSQELFGIIYFAFLPYLVLRPLQVVGYVEYGLLSRVTSGVLFITTDQICPGTDRQFSTKIQSSTPDRWFHIVLMYGPTNSSPVRSFLSMTRLRRSIHTSSGMSSDSRFCQIVFDKLNSPTLPPKYSHFVIS